MWWGTRLSSYSSQEWWQWRWNCNKLTGLKHEMIRVKEEWKAKYGCEIVTYRDISKGWQTSAIADDLFLTSLSTVLTEWTSRRQRTVQLNHTNTAQTIQGMDQQEYISRYYNTQFYDCSRQCVCPVGARCSMGFGRYPLINALIQHNFKINFLFLEKFIVISFD